MIIQKAQIETFEQISRTRFEEEMATHIQDFAPKHAELMGARGVRAIVHQGTDRAFEHGFTMRGPARLYLDLMFLFGSSFDTDPQLPWASSILSSPIGQRARADALYSQTMKYFERVAGADYQHAKASLRQAKGVSLESLRPRQDSDFSDAMLQSFAQHYPEKAAYVGEEPLRKLLTKASEQCAAYSIRDALGPSVFAGMMFVLGHGFATDLQFPWIAATLRKSAAEDRRLEQLFSKSQIYLDHVLRYIGDH